MSPLYEDILQAWYKQKYEVVDATGQGMKHGNRRHLCIWYGHLGCMHSSDTYNSLLLSNHELIFIFLNTSSCYQYVCNTITLFTILDN